MTFSSKYLKIKTQPSYKAFIDAIEKNGVVISYKWFNKKIIPLPRIIYSEATRAIQNADLFIAEVSIDSIGVGQQINDALQKKKPTILCMKKERKKMNNLLFLKGTRSNNLQFIYYKNLHDLSNQLKFVMRSIEEPTLEKFNFIATAKLKSIIKNESQKQYISQSALLRNIIEDWVLQNNLRK